MRAAPLAAAGLVLALAACGDGEAPRSSPAGTDLTVRVTGAGSGAGSAALRCGAGGTTCDERRLDRLQAALERSTDRGRVCTEVYGGPERAHVSGTLRGRTVDVRVTRSDGCGIADYEALFAALGRRPPLAP